MNQEDGHRTFRDLDGDVEITEPIWPLEQWYAEVRDARLDDLSVADLARACRQDLYPEAIVPLCLKKLADDPLAGELYDGELVEALKNVPASYWGSHPRERARFLELAALAYEVSGDSHLCVTEEVQG